MSQLTLYLDEATQTMMEQAAKSSGMSKSRWVAEMIRKHAHQEWSSESLKLAGRFPDLSLREEGQNPVSDLPRIPF